MAVCPLLGSDFSKVSSPISLLIKTTIELTFRGHLVRGVGSVSVGGCKFRAGVGQVQGRCCICRVFGSVMQCFFFSTLLVFVFR